MSLPWAQKLGFISSIILPFFNIPLMMRLVKRKSSEDLSLVWVLGVMICMIGMLPAGLQSEDLIFKLFSVLNFIFFSGVVGLTIYYRKRN